MTGSDKTEKPTPRRRQDARKKGQVAKSMEINTAVVLLAGLGVLAALGPKMLSELENLLVEGLQRAGDPTLTESEEGLIKLAASGAKSFAWVVGPIAAVAMIAGVVASVAQVRLKFTPHVLKPSLKKLSPLQGMKKVFGPQAVFEGLKATAKTGIVAAVAFMAVWPKLPELAALVGLPPAAILGLLGSLVLSVGFKAGGALAVIAAVDWAWQRRRHEKSLKMTKEELRREAKQSEVPPEVRRAIKQRQFEMARRRMLADVPTADVVVTNPTHYAIALRYDGDRPAPEIVARGMDLVARAIREIAEEHGVPIVSNPPLARALYKDVELGTEIPERFFQAVAEVLAFVYRTSGRRRRRRA